MKSITEIVTSIYTINDKIKELEANKAHLEGHLANLLGHGEGYSKTYKYDDYAITVNRTWNYIIDKEAYEGIKGTFPLNLDPVRQSIKYEVNPTKLKTLEESGDKDILKKLFAFVTKKPKKLYVKIEREEV